MVPERWQAGWDENLAVARLADDAGIDFLLPIARWKGYGGETDFQGTCLETITWATGLLASTRRITVFGTVHAPLFHPIIAAKQFVTADHVGHGRFGLNLVPGWNEGEFEMFGVELSDHEARYDRAQEWLDAVKAIWSATDDFDFRGEHYTMLGVRVKPKPVGGTRPMIMNAGASPRGRTFALQNCDAYFTGARLETLTAAAEKVAEIRAEAAIHGNDIGVYTLGQVICRPTRAEAEAYNRWCTEEHVDWGAVDAFIGLRRQEHPGGLDRLRRELAAQFSGFSMCGDPDDVAGMLARVSAAGFDGIGFSFVNYLADLPYFCDEVLPRLERLGLRVPVHALEET
jgi:dimethylsulfone monooxygenase